VRSCQALSSFKPLKKKTRQIAFQSVRSFQTLSSFKRFARCRSAQDPRQCEEL